MVSVVSVLRVRAAAGKAVATVRAAKAEVPEARLLLPRSKA